MSQQTSSRMNPTTDRPLALAPHQLALAVMWVLSTVSLLAMLRAGVRRSARFGTERDWLQVGYVSALIWYLFRTGPPVDRLPDISPRWARRWPWVRFVPVAALLGVLLMALSDEALLVLPLMMPAVPLVWVAWRKQVRLRSLAVGLALTVTAYLAGLTYREQGFVGRDIFAIMLTFTAPMFVAGGLLSDQTRLGGSRLHDGECLHAIKAFLSGCVLFVPLGLLDAASESPGGNMAWMTDGWLPLVFPWYSGVTEEVWYRFFFLGLCYYLVRPAFGKHRFLCIAFVTLVSAITFGMGHGGRWMDRLVYTSLLFGLPLAVTYARRDLEHAIGAHYMINVVSVLCVLLGR